MAEKKGHKQSEETKKKISEALTKNKGEDAKASAPTSPKAKQLFSQYNRSKEETIKLRAERDELRAAKKAIPRGKAGKAQKAALRKKIKAIKVLLRKQVTVRKIVREKAKRAQRVIKAEKRIKKAAERMKKLKGISEKVEGALRKLESESEKDNEDPKKTKRRAERIKRMRERIARVAASKTKQDAITAKSRHMIKVRGIGGSTKRDTTFDFSEDQECFFLAGKKFTKYRELTLQEKRCDFVLLNDTFNEEEEKLKVDLATVVGISILLGIKRTLGRLKAGDLKSIADISFINRTAIGSIIKEAMKRAYEVGKTTASGEINVDKPSTPAMDSQGLSFEAGQIADAFANDINMDAKNTAKNGYTKGVEITAIAVAINESLKNRASKMITNITGSTVGESINKGRRSVFEKNVLDIQAYQRSEILDSRTCNTCMSLDQRIVRADDQMAKLDLVHTHCRGVWVPIMAGENIREKMGLPRTVTDSFVTVGGVPTINSFTTLKKPINKANEGVQEEIKRRIDSK